MHLHNNSYNNSVCFCGSGKKYKVCHKRLEQLPVASAAIIGAQAQDWPTVKCMHYDANNNCSEAIRAHTVPKSNGLAPLAHQGHVLSFFPWNKFISENAREQSIGLKKASVFSGFCQHHDNISFREADTLSESSIVGFVQNIYRSLVFEKYKKLAGIRLLKKTSNLLLQGKDYNSQSEIFRMLSLQVQGQQEGIKILDLNISLAVDKIKRTSPLKGFCIKAEGPPLIAMSASYSPDYNLKGERMHRLGRDEIENIKYISLVAFYKDGCNYLMMGSVNDTAETNAYLHESRKRILENYYCGIQLAFNYCENVYFSQEFRNMHGDSDWQQIVNLVENVHANLFRFTCGDRNPLAQCLQTPTVILDCL